MWTGVQFTGSLAAGADAAMVHVQLAGLTGTSSGT